MNLISKKNKKGFSIWRGLFLCLLVFNLSAETNDVETRIKELEDPKLEVREAAQKFLSSQKQPAIQKMVDAFDDLNLEGQFRVIAILKQHYLLSDDGDDIEKAFAEFSRNKLFKKYIDRIMAGFTSWQNKKPLLSQERSILEQVFYKAQNMLADKRKKRDFKEILALYVKASRITSASTRSQCLYGICVCYAQLGHKKKAVKFLSLAISVNRYFNVKQAITNHDLVSIHKEESYLRIISGYQLLHNYQIASKHFQKQEFDLAVNFFIACSKVQYLDNKHDKILKVKASRDLALCYLLLKDKDKAKKQLLKSKNELERLKVESK